MIFETSKNTNFKTEKSLKNNLFKKKILQIHPNLPFKQINPDETTKCPNKANSEYQFRIRDRGQIPPLPPGHVVVCNLARDPPVLRIWTRFGTRGISVYTVFLKWLRQIAVRLGLVVHGAKKYACRCRCSDV